MEIKNILKMLEEEFERMMEIFDTKDWKFYKFGQGGPYKRTLTKLKRMSNEYDNEIIERFGLSKEIATFGHLVVLCISIAKDSKENYKRLMTFRKQIKFMRRTV